MKNILRKLKKNILFYTICMVIIFILLHFILKIFNMQFRRWIYGLFIIISTIGLITGIIQMAMSKNRIVSIIFYIIGIFLGIVIVFFCVVFLRIGIIFFAITFTPEHVITKDNQKYVVYVRSFLDVDVDYYDYINPFFMGNRIKIHEYYGEGGYDPFNGRHNNNIPINCVYYDYDNNGNQIIIKTILNEKNNDETEKKSIENTNIIYNSYLEEVEILYSKQIDNNISIRVLNKGNVLGQRCLISIEKSIDGGKTWINQLQTDDKVIQTNNESKYVFINENLGFINDAGLVVTDRKYKGLLVTNDGGKNFESAIFNTTMTELYVENVPYLKDNILELKAFTYEKEEKKYYYFSSNDNGITWDLIK